MSDYKLFLFNTLTPILTRLPKTSGYRKFVAKIYLWLCKEDVRRMLNIYYTYESAVSPADVGKILVSEGWSMKKVMLVHELCVKNKLIELL